MQISKVSVTMEIDGHPCAVVFSEMDEQKIMLFAQMVSSFCLTPGTLEVVKLSDKHSFSVIGKDDLSNGDKLKPYV